MAIYKFLLRRSGEDAAGREVEQDQTDDFEAFRTAESLAEIFDVKVTRNGFFVAHVNKNGRAKLRH